MKKPTGPLTYTVASGATFLDGINAVILIGVLLLAFWLIGFSVLAFRLLAAAT
jgi:hypothetical protein